VKKLLIGLVAVLFVAGSGLLVRADNQGEPDEESQANCSPTNLSVGYVDNDGPDGHPGSFFPVPFAPVPLFNPSGTCTGTPGAPDASNCIFVGTGGGNGHWDAGVLKIDNPSSTDPLKVQNVSIDIGPMTDIDLWKVFFPITIPPNGTLLLTGINNLFNFDTSDFPLGGAEEPPPIGTCTNDGFIPQIHVTVGSTTQITRNFADTTQVLNTQGIDGLCPPVHNEGQQYVQLKEVKNTCECDRDENGDDNGQDGGQGNGNDE
jgi:hypothetical protein